MLLAALLGTAFGASPLPFQTTGFMIGPIREETGWTLSQVSLGVTIYGILGALLAPAFGAMSDRFGVRRVALGLADGVRAGVRLVLADAVLAVLVLRDLDHDRPGRHRLDADHLVARGQPLVLQESRARARHDAGRHQRRGDDPADADRDA